MNRISRNISFILRAERMIAKRRMAVVTRKAGFVGAAVVLGAAGLVFLNVAAYLALAERMDPALAALLLAAGDLILALILVLVAGRMSAEADIAPVREMRDMAVADLESEVEVAAAEVAAIADSLKTAARHPLAAGVGLIGPLLTILLKVVSRDPAEKDRISEAEE
ncbi:phage holin family protein [Tropicimonas sp. IMCC6043]|uniref:phage holin family protein n=1 Tax=Tropicimonas sp. IMCC6043 TaxID=2510645 RepID=UPI00101BD8FA|nr:phage holin family protein [Tropicimonas sp. IMCC6043]RYH11665.1 hypothetical protein EU800_03240 [Tropicimonas sp. IMCC6043]